MTEPDHTPVEQQFSQFVYKVAPFLLGWASASAGKIDQGDVGFDIKAEGPGGETVLIETKLDTPSTVHRLRSLAEQLRSYAEVLHSPTIVLAVPGVLDEKLEEQLRAHHITLWDGLTLRRAADNHGIRIPDHVKLAKPVMLVKPRGAELIRHLRRLDPGSADWRPYQQWCTDALTYLFHPPLKLPLPENANATGVNRRDIILPNYAPDGFWAFMRTHYKADFVVADAKNYSGPISKGEVLQLANYLTLHGTGLFGLIVTRVGLDHGAEWTMREQWMLYNKLIVVLTDDDMRQTLSARDNNDEPEKTIRQKIEDFRLDL